jgi:hypothetical protein
MSAPLFFRRCEAAQFLKNRFGSEKSLAKFTSIGGGPDYRRVGTGPQAPAIYEPEVLDAWALAQFDQPLRSTADGPCPPIGRHA